MNCCPTCGCILTYGPHPGSHSDAAAAAVCEAFDVTMWTARRMLAAAHNPALGDEASVNRGEHRREVLAEVRDALIKEGYDGAAFYLGLYEDRRDAS